MVRFTDWLVETGMIRQSDTDAIELDVERIIDDAVTFAEQAPWEPVEDLTRDVMTPTTHDGARP